MTDKMKVPVVKMNTGNNVDEIKKWSNRAKNRIFNPVLKDVQNGVKFDYDTCLSISDRDISGALKIVGDSHVIFSSGACIIVKEISGARQQTIVSKKGCLRNVTALDAFIYEKERERDKEKEKKVGLVIGESSSTDSSSIAIHVCTAGIDSSWTTLSTQGIMGEVKRVHMRQDRRQLIFLVESHNDSKQQSLYVWNPSRDVILKCQKLDVTLIDVCYHPLQNKRFLFFSNSYLRTFDFDLKSKEFKDSKTLVNNRIESEGTFIDYQWIMRKGHCYLLVLSSNNTYRLFTDDFTTDPIEVKFGQIQKKVTLIHVAKNIARDVDDTFGFGNLSPEKGEKENMNQDEARDPNFNAGVRFKQVDGKLPSDFTSTALAASSEGFIVAGTGGIILFFRASEPTKHRESRKEMFALTNAYQMSNIKEDSRITYVSTDTRMRMLTLIVQTDVERMYYTLSDQTVGEEEIRLEKFFPAGYHNCKVYSISMSRARSIFVTSGQDEVIRIWAYDKINGGDKRAILEAPKQENPVSVSLHPLGFFLAVAFSSGFKVYALLQDNFFLLKETNIIHCSIVRYSTRGQYLLANQKSSIMVYDTIFYDNIYEFPLHLMHISSFIVYNDRYVFSNCSGGKVYHWQIMDADKPRKTETTTNTDNTLFDRTFAHENAKPYTCFVYDEKDKLFIASLPEKNLVVYNNEGKDLMFEYTVKDFSYTCLKLVPSAGVLLCGTSRGSVCVHLWPPVFTDREIRNYKDTQLFTQMEYYEIQPQLLPISHIIVTPKEDHIVTVSDDGMMFVMKMEIKDKPEVIEGKNQIDDKGGIAATINELFLVKQSYIKQQNRAIREKEIEVARYEKKKITDAEGKLRENRAKLAKIEKLFEQSKQSSKDHQTRFLAHSQENIRKQTDIEQSLKEKLQRESDQLQKETENIVAYEQNRNKMLREQFEKLKDEKKKLIQETTEMQVEQQKKMTEKYEENLRVLKAKYNKLMEEASEYGDVYLKKIELQENSHEVELNKKSAKLNMDIFAASKEYEYAQKANEELNAENDNNKKEDVKQQRKFEEEFIQNTKLQEEKVKIVVDLLKIQEQLLEREQVVFSKDETIKMARDEQINLENFQFLLKQKIKSLQENKKDLDVEIDAREKILRDMFNELIKQSQINSHHYNEIKDKMQKLRILEEQKKNIELRIYYWAVRIKDYHRKINSKINSAQKLSEVKILINKMIQDSNEEMRKHPDLKIDTDYVKSIANASSDVGTTVHKELIEQNTWLIKKLDMIAQASDNIKRIREENIETGLNQNKKLIEECNKLNTDNDYLSKKHRYYEKVIGEFEKKRKDMLVKEATNNKRLRQGDISQPIGLLPKLVARHDQEMSSEAKLNTGVSRLAESLPNATGKPKSLSSSAAGGVMKRPVPR